MIALKSHFNFLFWILLLLSPTYVLADQMLDVQRDIAAETDTFERQMHCLFRNKLAAELHRRVVRRNVRWVRVKGVIYCIEPAHIGSIWLREVDVGERT